MTTLQKDILKIIQSALLDVKVEISNEFDLQIAYDVAKKHGIAAMLYYGALNCGVDNNLPLMQEMFLYTCQCVSRYIKQDYELSDLLQNFDEHQIEHMPLKGTLIRNLYPKPEMRPMGDADILIKPKQYDEIKSIMLDLGYKEGEVSDHELTWLKPSLYVELHSRLIPSYNKDYYAYYGDGWQLAKCCKGVRYSMTDEDQMIYLFTHFAKHYRDAGIGLKHIIDIWIYRKNHKLDEEYIKKELKKLQLYVFYKNVNITLDVWFEGNAATPVTDLITEYIFDCGAAGKKENYIISDILKHSKSTQIKHSKLKVLFFYVFFPYKKMCMKYPFLKKIPIALPFMWIVRIFSSIFNKEKINSVKKNIEDVAGDQIVERQQALNFVGLDFNFKE